MKIRHISDRAKAELEVLGLKKREIYSFLPNDRYDCVCQSLVREWKDRLVKAAPAEREAITLKLGPIECPRDKTGMTRFDIFCNKCGEKQGYVWATDKTLTDWCDFHYYSWHDKTRWHGCFGPGISPIDGQLCFECACGNDTRDFRLCKSLPGFIAEQKEEENKVGRKFGEKKSKFRLEVAYA